MLNIPMDTDDISRKADEERARQNKKSWLSALNREEKPVFRPKSPESWWVYSRIYPYYFNMFIWVYIIMTLGVVFLALYYLEGDVGEWARYTGLAFIGLFAVRLVIHHTLKIIRFSEYKKWRSNLPFELTGWEKLGSFEHFPKGRYWNHYSSLRVILRASHAPQTEKVVKDALFLMCTEANKCFYEGWSGMDGRDYWKESDKEKLMVTGSANSGVVGDMYTCINKHLKAIHTKFGNIAKVEVVFSDRVSEVTPNSTD